MNTTHVKLSPTVLLAFVLLLCNLSAIARPQEKIKKKEISQSYSVSAGDRLQVETVMETSPLPTGIRIR